MWGRRALRVGGLGSIASCFLACSDVNEQDARFASPVELEGPGYGSGRGAGAGVALGANPSDEGGAGTGGTPEVPSEAYEIPPPAVQAGLLTAGAWDDNRNLEAFLGFHASVHEEFGQLVADELSLLSFSAGEHRAASEALPQPSAKVTLDVALVIDTTGSMGDELTYLQTEFRSLSSRIEAAYPEAEQRWSLIVYRDEQDEYVVRERAFEADLEAFRGSLAEQRSDGGGDFPEAPDAAFDAMNALEWRGGEDTARVAFWVADAPHHEANAGRMRSAIEASRARGIHVYPVASSGINETTELLMRSAAQLTGGRYLFLTDDSGIGGAHEEPTIPCYFVTRLDQAILRMVEIEMSGVYREPAASEVIRTGGDPTDGACTLAGGQTVFAF
jgi:hypothetical protein